MYSKSINIHWKEVGWILRKALDYSFTKASIRLEAIRSWIEFNLLLSVNILVEDVAESEVIYIMNRSKTIVWSRQSLCTDEYNIANFSRSKRCYCKDLYSLDNWLRELYVSKPFKVPRCFYHLLGTSDGSINGLIDSLTIYVVIYFTNHICHKIIFTTRKILHTNSSPR